MEAPKNAGKNLMNMRISPDFDMVGFNNEPFTQLIASSISSIHRSPVEMGRMTAQVFLEQMEREVLVKIQKNEELPPGLIIKKSSSKLGQ